MHSLIAQKKKSFLIYSDLLFCLLLGKFSLLKKNVLRIIQIDWEHMENARMVNTHLLLANVGVLWWVFLLWFFGFFLFFCFVLVFLFCLICFFCGFLFLFFLTNIEMPFLKKRMPMLSAFFSRLFFL